MATLRALLFAVFGGFIGAAPAAPVVPGPEGALADAPKQTQKSERPGCDVCARAAPSVAAAPPISDAPPTAAGSPPIVVARPPAAFVAVIPLGRDRPVPPPLEDVRAGLLDLPPPAR
jgi:hypothetical protein